MNEIGIRQGRLSPPALGPIQRFPYASWKDEFVHASGCGFAFIDWLVPAADCERNPIWSDGGQADIHAAISATGVSVRSLCADYFMVHPFVRVSDEERQNSERLLSRLIVQSSRAGIRIVVLPLLEAAEIRDRIDMTIVRTSLSEALDLAAALSMTIAIEADLPAAALVSILDLEPHPALGACYDTGNAAASGFDVTPDLAILGPRLSLVHIKDRDSRGISVRLGSGAADLPAFFRTAARLPYTGPLVLETPRGDNPIEAAKANLRFLHAQDMFVADGCRGSRAD
jgi:hexulose-6-phosphate isomerase